MRDRHRAIRRRWRIRPTDDDDDDDDDDDVGGDCAIHVALALVAIVAPAIFVLAIIALAIVAALCLQPPKARLIVACGHLMARSSSLPRAIDGGLTIPVGGWVLDACVGYVCDVCV